MKCKQKEKKKKETSVNFGKEKKRNFNGSCFPIWLWSATMGCSFFLDEMIYNNKITKKLTHTPTHNHTYQHASRIKKSCCR